MSFIEIYAFLESVLEILHDLSQHIDRYCCNLVLRSVIVLGGSASKTFGFRYPHKKTQAGISRSSLAPLI